jgi:tRNA(Ile)-lysidine synthase
VPVKDRDLARWVREAFEPTPPLKLGVAVSGGGDSVALLHLLVEWSREGGPELHAVTVDHGLRAEAAGEAEGVAAMCQALGVPHVILRWQGWDGTGNLMDAARRARISLIAGWAKECGIEAVTLGHTMDDQAETFLMRLARGSGVDGLSAMAAHRRSDGITWERPLLGVRRAELREYLTQHGVRWVDDPTNDDAGFDRIKARQALELLGRLGITPDRIGSTVFMMSLAREALQVAVARLAKTISREEAGIVVVEKQALAMEPYETGLRFLAEAVRWVSSSDYRPRLEALMDVHADVVSTKKRTLSGCILQSDATHTRISREPRAVAKLTSPTDQPWDTRWHVSGPHAPDLEIRALGAEGLRQVKDWRATGLPRDTLIVTPGIWRDGTLVAAPSAGFGAGWTATVSPPFVSFLLSH